MFRSANTSIVCFKNYIWCHLFRHIGQKIYHIFYWIASTILCRPVSEIRDYFFMFRWCREGRLASWQRIIYAGMLLLVVFTTIIFSATKTSVCCGYCYYSAMSMRGSLKRTEHRTEPYSKKFTIYEDKQQEHIAKIC